MREKTIWYFVKFTEEKYADQFMKGSLYLNRLSHFKKNRSCFQIPMMAAPILMKPSLGGGNRMTLL